MATIQIKRNNSNAATKPSSLLVGELAGNLLDRSLFSSDGSNVFQFYTGTTKWFDTSGNANNANKLGGTAASSYATQTWVENKKYLTTHQSIYSLTINNSAGTAQVTYTPNSKAASLTLTKSMVGLSNVENTALSTWVGSAKITTLGTITSGTWNGTKIANGYLANSSMTIAGTSVSLGGSITAATLKTNLGLGSLAYKSSLVASDIPSLDWSKITSGKPTTAAGYGIVDALTFTNNGTYVGASMSSSDLSKLAASAYVELWDSAGWWNLKAAKYIVAGGTSSQFLKGDGSLDGTSYLPLSGGTISGNIVWGKGKWGVDASARGVFMSWNDSNYLHITNDGAFYNWNTLIHSGNIGSQKVERARYIETLATDGHSWYEDSYRIYGQWASETTLDWKVTGYEVRVDRAKKLNIARTIWGQSFDGSGNVSGNLHLGTSALYWLSDSANYSIQIKDDGKAYYKAYYGHYFYSSATERMRITSGGNVLIGTTTDSGAKLQVNGGITSDSIKLGSYTLEKSTYGMTLSGQYVGLTLKGTNAYNTGVSFADADGVERWVLSYRGVNGGANKDLYIYRTTDNGVTDTVMRLYRASGNVVIGGTADNGAKLQVTGNLTVTGDGVFGSDARYKSKLQDLAVDVETIANAPVFSYKWTDREDDKVHLGTTAQYWMETNFKDAVDVSNKDFYHLNYGALGVAIGVSLAKKAVDHEERIKALEKENKELKNEIKQLKQWLN